MSNISKLRTISIDPQFLNISKKKIKQKPMIASEININSNNIKQLLLEKLRQHKKSKKNKGPLIQTNTFDEQNTIKPQLIEKDKPIEVTMLDKPVKVEPTEIEVCVETPKINIPVEESIEVCESFENKIQPDKPYGVLKNGTKPTYKIWSKQEPEAYVEPIIEEREIQKTFILGKKNKSVSVLIKNNKTRKQNEESKINLKKTSLTTLKNHLKKNNLIKFGTTAPSDLLREMYENSKLCGEISNNNPANIVHNFKQS
jgi:molybdenum cofactor biosynthesis enzyme